MTSCAVIECHFLAWLRAVAEVLSPCAFSKNITEATLTRHRFRVGITGEATKRIFRQQVAYGQLPHFLCTRTTSFSFPHLHPSIKHLFLKLPTSIKTYNLCIHWKHTLLSCVDLYCGQNNPKQTNQQSSGREDGCKQRAKIRWEKLKCDSDHNKRPFSLWKQYR